MAARHALRHRKEFALPEHHAQYYRHLARANGLAYHNLTLVGAALYSKVAITIPQAAFERVLDATPL